MSSEHEEALARMRAEQEQVREAQKEAAASLWTFFNSCLEAGFSRKESLALTRTQLGAALGRPTEEQD